MADVHLSTKICCACSAEKAVSDFYHRTNRHGNPSVDCYCKPCRIKITNASARRPERLDAAREWRKQHKARLRRAKGALPRSEWLAARKAAAVPRVNHTSEATKAWRHWITERAPAWWLDAYYAASGKPWTDHRLTDAEQFRMQYRLDPEFNLKQRLRAAMKRKRQGIRLGELLRWAVERNGSSPKAEQFVGYTAKDLRQHLERQFTKGMTWERFCAGEIHIDHIVPLTAHDISNPDELKAAWAITNLRPLWASDNIRKSASRTHLL